MKYIVYSPDETTRIAKNFAEKLRAGDIVRLYGDIGVGKTVFVKGVTDFFGNADEVCSPTFSIMNIYSGSTDIFHFDLYRIEDESEIYEAGLFDYIGGSGISLIEWPDVASYSGNRIFDVTISKNLDISDDYREIEINDITCN